jgi:hypothetical protein
MEGSSHGLRYMSAFVRRDRKHHEIPDPFQSTSDPRIKKPGPVPAHACVQVGARYIKICLSCHDVGKIQFYGI